MDTIKELCMDFRKFITSTLFLFGVIVGSFYSINTASAITLFDTGQFGDGSPIQVSTTQQLAAKFTLSADASVTNIEAYLTVRAGGVSAQVWSDGGTTPNANLFSKSISVPSSPVGWVSFAGLNWVLTAGSYWFVLIPDSTGGMTAGWYNSAVNSLADASSTNGVSWQAAGLNLPLRVNGDVSAVPIPAALPLFGTGIAIIGFLGWRRKRKAV